MPIFEEISVKVDIDFEVFCTCGNGICNKSETRKSRVRGEPQVVVEPCEICIKSAVKEAEEEVEERLGEEIENLKEQIEVLRSRLEDAQETK